MDQRLKVGKEYKGPVRTRKDFRVTTALGGPAPGAISGKIRVSKPRPVEHLLQVRSSKLSWEKGATAPAPKGKAGSEGQLDRLKTQRWPLCSSSVP